MKILYRWLLKICRLLLVPKRKWERRQRRLFGIKTCQSKRPFTNRDDAWRYALNVGKIRSVVLSPYKCRYCGLYHITSKYTKVNPPKGIKL